MSSHDDKPADRTVERASILARQKAQQVEEQRVLKADKDAKRIKKDEVDRASRAKADLEKIASGLKPVHHLQLSVTSKLTEQVTYELGRALRNLNEAKEAAVWVCPSRGLAIETLQRAYPLALQMGIMANVRDLDCSLHLHNGSAVYFNWPGKGLAV